MSSQLALDRLISSLFVSSLGTGVLILGVTFGVPKQGASNAQAALDVILVQQQTAVDEAPDTEYLSTLNQRGSGNTQERVTVASQVSTGAEFDNPGKDNSPEPFKQQDTPIEATQAVVMAHARDATYRLLNEVNEEVPAPTMEARLMRASDATLEPVTPQHDENRAHSQTPDPNFSSVATKQSTMAQYLAGWKRKVEQVGTANFREQSSFNAEQNPVVQVVIASDGTLEDMLIQRSSGSPTLDRFVLSILRKAAPYEPFPEALKAERPRLEFVYEWHFKAAQY